MSPDVLFGPFRLHGHGGRLLRGTQPIPLTPRAFAVLQYLAGRPGRLVTKAELLGAVWPGTHVTEEVLKVSVREVRRALGDSARSPQFIETAHRRGYRFIGRSGPTVPPGTEGARLSLAAAGFFPSVGSAAVASYRSPGIVGRRVELDRLRALFDQALCGQRRVVFVTGEPGIGKTATVEAFLDLASAEPDVLAGRGQCIEQYGAGEAWLPVLDALGALARGPAGDWLAGHLRRFAPTWLMQMPALVEDEEREQLRLETLGATAGRMLREITEAIEALTAGTTLVLLLEDLHWSDYSTLDLISLLARRREPGRLLLIGTYRDSEVRLSRHPVRSVNQELLARGLCERIPLGLLTREAVQEYLRARFPGLAHLEELSRAIHDRTDGNPLFMVNVVDFVSSRVMPGGAGASVDLDAVRQEIASGVPDSLRQMIQKQIDRLTRQERSVLEAASAVSLEFSAVAVAAGLEQAPQQVEEICEQLAQRRQFLRAAGARRLPDGTVSARFAFIHSLYQNVLYDQTPLSRRLRLHQRIAERGVSVFGGHAGEIAAELAMHFEQGGDFTGAVHYLQIAAANARRRRAYREAIDHLKGARALARRLPADASVSQEIGLLERLGSTRRSMGDMKGAARDFEAMAKSGRRHGRREEETRGLLYLASALSWMDGRGCLAAARKALSVSQGLDNPLLQSHTRAYVGYWNLMLIGWTGEGVRACETAIAAARQAGDLQVLSQHLVRRAYSQCLQSHYREACDTAREGRKLTVEIDEAFDYLVAQFFLAWALMRGGQLGEALRAAGEGMRMAERNEHHHWEELFRLQEAWILAESFSFDAARRRCEQWLAGRPGSGLSLCRMMALGLLGKAWVGLKRTAEAFRCFDEMTRLARREPVVLGWVWLMEAGVSLAECQLAVGSLSRAREEAGRALELASASGELTCLARARALAARAALGEGDAERAEQEVRVALDALEGREAPLAQWQVLGAAAEIAEARGIDASPLWRSSATTLARLADSLEAQEDLRGALLANHRVRSILDKARGAA